MVVLEGNRVSKTFGAQVVLDGVSFKIGRGEKVGLIGENGSGKSTLLKMIVGTEPVTDGVIVKPKGLRVGYLAQQMEFSVGRTVYQEVREAFRPVLKLEAELKQAEAAMSDSGADPKALEAAMARYGQLQEAFERRGGYACEQRISTVLDGLGISRLRERRVASLSGGEKNIVALARVLLQAPDVLLLDEPGNHLDFEGLAWLEQFLQGSDRTVVLVAHDRYLLDRVAERILEIEDRKIVPYSGNYSAYRVEKMRGLLKQKAAYQDQQKEIQRLEEMIRRFEFWGGDKNFRRARSRQKALDRMERIERPSLDRERIDPAFETGDRGGRIALEVRGYSKAFGERVLFRDVHLLISSGDRVGLLGANGTGKTTLFRDVVKEAAWGHPVLRIGPRAKLGYYAQEHETLDPKRTVLEEVQREAGLTKGQAFTLLSKFLFRWEEMDKRVGTLSGGEKGRVQLAKLMASGANFLLLDEPTNHLDIASREQVEEALEAFEGTVLVISHDRYFLDRIVDRVVEVRNPDLVEYPGNFSFFWEKKREEQRREAPKKRLPAGGKKPSAPGPRAVEEKIDGLEAERLKLEQTMASAYRTGAFQKGERISRRLRRLDEQLEKLYDAL